MTEKLITMSLHEYEMLSVENEMYKAQYEELKDEKMVYLTIVDQGPRYSHHSHHKISGQIVKKDKLLKNMQDHLEEVSKIMAEKEDDYKRQIRKLKEELYQVSNPVPTKWWQKLFK